MRRKVVECLPAIVAAATWHECEGARKNSGRCRACCNRNRYRRSPSTVCGAAIASEANTTACA